MNKKYVVMCDYGLDDACATVYLLDNRDESDQVDIMPIGGNSEVNVAHRNAHTLLAHYDGDLTGVRIIDTREEKHAFAVLPSIHGNDGMGDMFTQKRSNVPEIKYPEWINEKYGAITLVSLGPCTLTREIMAKRQVESLLIMGGCVAEEPNFNGYEFNHALDLDAFNECVKSDVAVVATLDSCRCARFNYAKKRFDGNNLLSRLLNCSVKFATARHDDRCYVYDYIAVNYLFNPETFTIEKVTDPSGNVIRQLKSKI